MNENPFNAILPGGHIFVSHQRVNDGSLGSGFLILLSLRLAMSPDRRYC